MSFVHGHPRESGWVMSHYRRPQHAGDDQLDLSLTAALPAPRAQQDEAEQGQDETPEDADEPDTRASVRSIPRRTASTR
ncbi:hypothetical protein [Actinomycetospora lemnae]|uniref:Uncharacterized protein n=1 Tax=Actinomycetospora lemnae TaxID=3019891 RepID=A0ABT5SPY5_9PSEU|nr:hypothetical protein [Actinomycetospora sp. DW7H6]MDD7964903.1 hypothetical protein [Actinomycetospora sp. DW7H6]